MRPIHDTFSSHDRLYLSLFPVSFLTTLADLAMQNAQKVETAFQSIMKCLPSLNHIETLDILPDTHSCDALDDISALTLSRCP